jgi:hypothetical protein
MRSTTVLALAICPDLLMRSSAIFSARFSEVPLLVVADLDSVRDEICAIRCRSLSKKQLRV